MPVSRRTGKKYAAGSHDTLGGWESKTCCICSQPIVKSRQSARFTISDRYGIVSWHTLCERPGVDPRSGKPLSRRAGDAAPHNSRRSAPGTT